jgi:hypothetical protein
MVGLWFVCGKHSMSDLIPKIDLFYMETTVSEKVAEYTADTGNSMSISTATVYIDYLFQSIKVVF